MKRKENKCLGKRDVTGVLSGLLKEGTKSESEKGFDVLFRMDRGMFGIIR